MNGTKVLLVGLVVALAGLLLAGPASAQQPSITVTPSSVPEAGIYDFEVEASGYTEAAVHFAVCNTIDPAFDTSNNIQLLMEHCGSLGDLIVLENGSFSTTVEDLEVTSEGVTFLAYVPVALGERALVTVSIGEPMGDELPATGTDTSLLVILGTGIALAGVMVLSLSRRIRTDWATGRTPN